MFRLHHVALVLLVTLASRLPEARADLVGDANIVVGWTRRTGSYSDVENPARTHVKSLDPSRLGGKLRRRKLLDVQYGETREYHGVWLSDLVALYQPGPELDTVILHFENGMGIPVRLADLQDLRAFVALDGPFEDVPRRDVYGDQEDPRPIQFSWNKLVVPQPTIRAFSPWRHVDSLSGLEFAVGAAYDAQFTVGTSGGEQVFLNRCQFCHAARYIGGRFGWDFVNPLPLGDKRPPANLTNHVKYRKVMAPRLGIKMPPQPDVELPEMTQLWRWMKDVAAHPLRPYAP